MQKIIWEVQYTSTLPVSKYCKKCRKKTEYKSSGQFRVNAQRKSLDIWLIYKCSDCDTTWNVDIFSRINPKSLSSSLLERFHNNDEMLAGQYAMDASLLRRNGGEVGLPDYLVSGDSFSLHEPVELHIESKYSSQIKVSTILRSKLNLSQRVLEDMVAQGVIKSTLEQDLQKCKLQNGIILTFENSI